MSLNRHQRELADTAAEELRKLAPLAQDDPERAHSEADTILLDFVAGIDTYQTDELCKAFRDLANGARWWAAG